MDATQLLNGHSSSRLQLRGGGPRVQELVAGPSELAHHGRLGVDGAPQCLHFFKKEDDECDVVILMPMGAAD